MEYVYCWTMRPSVNLEVELRVKASTAPRARRELTRFLDAQAGGDWTICALSRAPEGELGEPAQRLLRASEREGAARPDEHAWERAWRRA